MRPNWFIGFPVDAEPWYTEVVASVPAGIKRFMPADLHITFAFLGSVGEDVAMATWEEAQQLDLAPLSYTLGPMAPFGNPRRPSAYAFTLDKGRARVVDYLQRYTSVLLEIAGQKKEERPPRPHVTVARPPRKASDDLRATGIAWLKRVSSPDNVLQLDKIALFTWADDRRSRLFKIVHTRSL